MKLRVCECVCEYVYEKQARQQPLKGIGLRMKDENVRRAASTAPQNSRRKGATERNETQLSEERLSERRRGITQFARALPESLQQLFSHGSFAFSCTAAAPLLELLPSSVIHSHTYTLLEHTHT